MEEQEEEQQLFQAILDNDRDKIEELLQEESEIDVHQYNSDGRTPLDLAAITGRSDILKLLLQKCDTIKSNSSGYSPLHYSVTWGQLECLRVLVNEGGGDYTQRTRHQENVKELAARYGRTECVRFIESTEAREVLKKEISSARETLSTAEKIAGKWNKDDKNKVNGLCNEKTEWLERNIEAVPFKTLEQVQDFRERYEPHLNKLNPVNN